MKLLVIGSEGFIGRHLIQYFENKGLQVIGCDLISVENANYLYYKVSRDFKPIFQTHSFDFCINAGGSGNVQLSMESPLFDFKANSLLNFQILECIRLYNLNCKFINISSAAVYGNPRHLPVLETDLIQPISPYGWHKYYSELISKEFWQLYGVKTCSIRPFSIFGPYLKKQLFWDLYLKSTISLRINLSGTGNETRDFIFIDDFVECIDLIFNELEFTGQSINCATGIETSVLEAAELFVKTLNRGNTIHFNGIERPGDPKNWKANIDSLINIGFVPKTTMIEGINKYVKWIQTQE